jgi:hypothetical protein
MVSVPFTTLAATVWLCQLGRVVCYGRTLTSEPLLPLRYVLDTDNPLIGHIVPLL